MRKHHIAFVMCLLGTFWSGSSYAVVVNIDSFTVSGTNAGGAFNLVDHFNDGTPPPCGPNGCTLQPNYYGVNIRSPLTLPAESGGLLELNSANGIASTNAGGGARRDETVQVAGITRSELLSSGGAISMTGIFTLPEIYGPLNEGYGIRFIDATPGVPGSNQEVLELNVQWWTGGNDPSLAGWDVRYLVQNFNTHSINTIGFAPVNIPQGYDEICLSLDRVAGSDMFAASYEYGTGGICGVAGLSPASLGSAQGFAYTDYVRPQFHAFETVPEPGTIALGFPRFLGHYPKPSLARSNWSGLT